VSASRAWTAASWFTVSRNHPSGLSNEEKFAADERQTKKGGLHDTRLAPTASRTKIKSIQVSETRSPVISSIDIHIIAQLTQETMQSKNEAKYE